MTYNPALSPVEENTLKFDLFILNVSEKSKNIPLLFVPAAISKFNSDSLVVPGICVTTFRVPTTLVCPPSKSIL